jgi:2-hydroxy-6-oxonona-2,4-dienedioate hydrolase
LLLSMCMERQRAAAVGMNRRGLLILGLATAAAAAAGGATWRNFSAEMARARSRVATGSNVLEGRFGAMEYATTGNGPPCLMIHGTGGGFDQGLAFAAPLADAGWTVIAPSRFGYLRSAFPADPSSENQADTFIDLMDELGIARAPVIGGSAGALSAIQFAIRHPYRCSALVVIVPAAYAPDHPPARPPNALARAIIEHGLRSDLLFWAGLVMAEDSMIGALLATDPVLVHAASLAEQARVRSILREIQPVSLRAEGLLNDGALAGNPKPMELERIVAPTFVVSLEDDRFETAAAARHIASSVPGAELVIYPSGGHVWVGHNDDLFARIEGFLRKHEPDESTA